MLLIHLCFLAFLAPAQLDTIHSHYFSSGEISTLITMTNQLQGIAVAYNRSGEVIYTREVRRFAGTASVQFRHYNSGAVKTANYYEAPDGGIQWYRKYTFFSEDGIVTKEQEDSHDAMQRVLVPDPEYTPTPFTPRPPKKHQEDVNVPREKEIAVCGPIHVNRVVFVNHTKRQIGLQLINSGESRMMLIDASSQTEPMEYLSMAITSPLSHNMRYTLKSFRKKITLESAITVNTKDVNTTEYVVHIFETSR
jgi:hypothetical protein